MTMPDVSQTSHSNPDVLVGERIHQLMFRKRVTQTELAARMYITQSALSKKLRGQSKWSLTDLICVAGVLGVGLLDLMHDDVLAVLPAEVYERGPRPVRDEGLGLPRQDLNLRPSDYTSCEVIVGPWAGAA